MVFFIAVLRALAACLITNAHYEGIYPTDLIANGGLLGDILFFAISGYCLCRVKTGFLPWYGKRVYRIYPPVIISAAVYLFLGFYSISEHNMFWWFVYPTNNHFVTSIMLLYVPFYFCMRIDWLRSHLIAVMAALAIAWIGIYIAVYDKSYYHIDSVREPMIRFLFMESMLLGAWYRQNDAKVRNHFRKWDVAATLVLFIAYFASKLLFVRNANLAGFQCVNQIIIFALLFFLFRTFDGLDGKLQTLPRWFRKGITFLANMTLEIYLVQNVLIRLLRPIGHFPANWIAITASILGAAFALHTVCGWLYRIVAVCRKERDT